MANLAPKSVTITPNGSYVDVEMEGHDISEMIAELEDMGWDADDAVSYFGDRLFEAINHDELFEFVKDNILDRDAVLALVDEYLDADDLANLLLQNEVA